jgi:hypothetical protein
LVTATTLVLASPAVVHAKVFHAREEMLALAFPDADDVDARDYLLTAAQRVAIETRAQAALESDLLTIYTGHKDGAVLGYALLDTHVVRTLPEAFLVVLAPDGRVAATHVLAFYEPLEYLPSGRWLEQFGGSRLSGHLRVGGEIVAITGSTLTSRGVRRALAAYEVLIAPCDSSSAESGLATDSSR